MVISVHTPNQQNWYGKAVSVDEFIRESYQYSCWAQYCNPRRKRRQFRYYTFVFERQMFVLPSCPQHHIFRTGSQIWATPNGGIRYVRIAGQPNQRELAEIRGLKVISDVHLL